MRHWLTRADPRLRCDTIKRFEPSHWTVDFPRGSMASVVSEAGAHRLTVTAAFGRQGDLVGLIYTSDDPSVHIGHRRHHKSDYSNCTLKFRWRSAGLLALDAVNGPTLTIEGKDQNGAARTWYVRLWNYASGSGDDATITLPFDDLRSGFQLTPESERVDVRQVDRLFISIVPLGFVAGSDDRFTDPVQASVELSEIECLGSGSVIPVNDAFVPEHDLRICTAYDDCYHLTPERVIDGLERLGYRRLINHYVGMSHYPRLGGDGLVVPATPLNAPALRWHESFAAIASARGFDVIWSISMELLDSFCPDAWKQRDFTGAAARTGYDPPSTLLSPAVPAAVQFLADAAREFISIGLAAGLKPLLQIGEPWWWINPGNQLCLYDQASLLVWPQDHEPIVDIRSVTSEQAEVLDQAGGLLSAATATIVAAARDVASDLVAHLLIYLPTLYRSDAPNLLRCNLPVGWHAPAFDILQLEDYEWVTAGLTVSRERVMRETMQRLGHAPQQCHYLSGFVSSPQSAGDWAGIIDAASAAKGMDFSEVFLWALPQVFRDSLTVFEGEKTVQAFKDVLFPLNVGLNALVEPCFSTTVSTSPSGFEYRNADWQQARLRFDVGPGLRSVEDLQELLRFFRSMRGNAFAFRFRDSTDFSSAGMTGAPTSGDIVLGIGDGSRRRYPLFKTYGGEEIRRITRPDPASIVVSVDGSDVTNFELAEFGVLEFDTPPAVGEVVRAGFLFDVPVRFQEPSLKVSRKSYQAGEIAGVPLIEVREA